MRKKFFPLLLVALFLAGLLAACGDTPTNTPAATSAATTSAATTAAATSAAATSAAAATTAASATSAAAATTAAVATTAAATDAKPDAAGIYPFQKYAGVPQGGQKGGDLKQVSLTKQLASTLHPYPNNVAYTASWQDVATYLFSSTLLDYDPFNLRWRYGAAEKLEISQDNLTFTFTIRPGMKFSDGSAITAEDYVYPVEQATKEDKDNPDNNFVSIDNFQKIESFTAPNANTVVCKLKAQLPTNLALSYCGANSPVKKSLWSQYPFYDSQKNPEILKPTVVSGPYKLKSYNLDEKIVLEANTNYYKGEGNYATITFLPAAQPTNAYESVKAGQNNYADDISPSQYNEAKGNTNINFFEWASANGTYRYIEFNLGRAPFNDIAMRKAIAHAIDRQALLKAADNGLGALSNSFIQAADKTFYNPNVTNYNFDLNKAKQILKDAGYVQEGDTLKDKTGKAVEFTVVFPTSSNPRKLQATYLQQQMKQLGIKVNVDGQEFNAYVAKVNAQDYDVSLGASGGGIPPDPDGTKAYFITKEKGGTQNRKGYSNAKIDELFTKAGTEPQLAKRAEYYKEIQQILSDDLPVVFLYTLIDYSVTTKDVNGAKNNALDRMYYDEQISTWSVKAK
jgi:peptide/nickel transport system substrate-binding protein